MPSLAYISLGYIQSSMPPSMPQLPPKINVLYRLSSPQHPFRRLMRYVYPYWWAMLLVTLGFIINSATEVSIAKILQQIIDAIGQNNQAQMSLLPLLVIVLFVARGIGAFLGNYFSALISRNLVYELRVAVFNKLLRLPSGFYLKNPAGTISSKLIFDVEQVTAASTDSLKTLIRDGFTIFGLLVYLLYLNWKLSLLLFLVLPPIMVLVRYASKQFLNLSKGIQQTMGEVSHISNEVIHGYQVVKNYGGQDYEQRRFNKASKSNLEQGLKVVVVASINTPIIQLLLAMALSAIMWIAMRPQVLSGISAGEFVSYLVAAGLIVKPVQNLTDINQRLQRGVAAAESIFELLDHPEEEDLGKQSRTIKGVIDFDGVSLVYEDGTTAIDEFNLHIAEGETVAFVGRSGAGKTSLVNLLTRTLQPNTGSIRIDGVLLNDYSLASLRNQIAMVNQQVILFNDSVKNNIAYGKLADKSDAEIQQAIKTAYADEFIAKLPQGIDSQIGAEGLQLSGGQRQRLSIARALLKDAPILILDEATSALDNESEHFIQQALNNVMKNRTTLVIAHRLTTIEKADKIVVMEQGKIIEIGSHDTLMSQNGVYSQLYRRNFDENLPV